MKCIFCDKSIDKTNLISLFLQEDKLCCDCRNKLKVEKKIIKLNELKVECLYNYDGIFKEILLQYKECLDEALADVFLYMLNEYIALKYHGYTIVYVASSKQKLEYRGFNHLQLIFKNCNLNKIDGIKSKHEMIQEGKNLSQRQMIIDNFYYDGPNLNKVLIVDDVLTTGSSILAAYNAMKPHAKRVKALSLSYKENAFIFNNKCAKIKKRRII